MTQLTYNTDWYISHHDRIHAHLTRAEMRKAKTSILIASLISDGILIQHNKPRHIPVIVALFRDGSQIEYYARRMIVRAANGSVIAQIDIEK